MEVTATVSRPGLHFSGAAGLSIDAGDLRLGNGTFKVSLKPRRFSGFSASGHLQYYVSPRSGGKKKEKEKSCETVTVTKKLKLIKRLSKDLPMLSQMASGGVETANGLLGEVKGKMISEATEVLLAQLQQLRSEQKELKRERKEKKAQMKATLMKAKAKCESSSSSSSSSSSESSDSERGEVIDMSCWRSESLTCTIKSE